MKKFCIIFLLSIIISLTAVGFSGASGKKTENTPPMYATNINTDEYLRMHIRADSNEKEAQEVKYYVRDKVVEYLTPLVANYENKTQATAGVKENLDEIAKVATQALRAKGYFYGASAQLKTEAFPTRVYGDCILPAGEYSALVVRLGSGRGDNWWCVVYPPLCFVAPRGENVIYKSKIKEIIERFYQK